MSIQFKDNRWLFGDFPVFHEEDNCRIGFINKENLDVYVEQRVIKIKFGMESPELVYVNSSDVEDTLPFHVVANDEKFAPVFHYTTIVSHRVVLFADSSNPLSADGIRKTEKVFSVTENEEVEVQPSIILQAFCSQNIDDIESELARLKAKYSTLYFLTKTKLISRDIVLNIQVIR